MIQARKEPHATPMDLYKTPSVAKYLLGKRYVYIQ
jgi:hypothetical protein